MTQGITWEWLKLGHQALANLFGVRGADKQEVTLNLVPCLYTSPTPRNNLFSATLPPTTGNSEQLHTYWRPLQEGPQMRPMSQRERTGAAEQQPAGHWPSGCRE